MVEQQDQPQLVHSAQKAMVDLEGQLKKELMEIEAKDCLWTAS